LYLLTKRIGLFKTADDIILFFSCLSLFTFRKQKLQLKTQGPVSHNRRLFHIVEGLHLRVHGLIADPENFAAPAADGHQSGVIAVRLPVGRDDRRADRIPAIGQIIVDKGLNQHGVDVIATVVTGK